MSGKGIGPDDVFAVSGEDLLKVSNLFREKGTEFDSILYRLNDALERVASGDKGAVIRMVAKLGMLAQDVAKCKRETRRLEFLPFEIAEKSAKLVPKGGEA